MRADVAPLLATAVGVGVLCLSRKSLLRWWRRSTAVVKLTYFNIDGLGEPIRYTLALSGVPFEDFRFDSRVCDCAPRPHHL